MNLNELKSVQGKEKLGPVEKPTLVWLKGKQTHARSLL